MVNTRNAEIKLEIPNMKNYFPKSVVITAKFCFLRQCHTDFLFCITWKKNRMRDALKSFYFRKKKVDVGKGILFLFYQPVMEMLFLWKNLSISFTNRNFADFAMKTLYLAFKIVVNTVEPVLKTTCIKRPPLHNDRSQVCPSNFR